MNTYKQLSATTVQRQSDGAFIPTDPANTDYQLFLSEQADGAVVLPADVPNPNDAINAQIAALEARAYLNRGSRELEMRQIEKELNNDAALLSKQPYYMRLKWLDDQIRALRAQLK